MTAATNEGSNRQNLPPEIYAGLVDTLFGTVGSFVSGIFGGLLVPLIAWLRTGDPTFLVATAIITLIAAVRITVLLAYKRTPEIERAVNARAWERAYALGGVGFMTAVGLTAAVLLFRSHDELTALYGVVITLGCAGSLAGRNAGRPKIVMGQILGVCAPVAFIFLTHFNAWYWGLSFIFLLVLTSVRSTTHFLNRMLVAALLSHREALSQGQLLGTALNSMAHGLCMMESDGTVTVLNQRLRDVLDLGYRSVGPRLPEQPASIAHVDDLIVAVVDRAGLSEAEASAFAREMKAHVQGVRTSSFTHQIQARIFLFRFEAMTAGGCVMVVEDITEARRSAEQVERLAHFDTLTGLANRFAFQRQLRANVAEADIDAPVALLSIDLDRFKDVNDTLGHPMGDKLLQQVAERLQSLARPSDLVARFGGDEFQILLRPSLGECELDDFAGRVVSMISAPYQIDEHAISIGASVGVALAPQDAPEADDLLKCADLALYSAKAASRGRFRRFVPELDVEAHRKRRIEIELREALTAGHLEVHYQPAIDVRTGRVATFEALARWRHPIRGLIPPGEFIPIAEETGQIAEIGEFILNRACVDAMAWPHDVRVAVNVSGKQFLLRQDMAGRIMAVLGRTGLPADRLELEITESTLIDANEPLASLARLGVRISLDDFGTGYSSLAYLRQFKIDKIKIDQSFIKNEDEVSLAIVDAVSFLASSMKVDLVVEGVETERQRELVVERRVHLIQGYLFSKPLPIADIAPLLAWSKHASHRDSHRAAA